MNTKQYKGIILAGGSGTRLYPATQALSKQLLPVYDKPMIYYPLSILMLAEIREILIISTPDDISRFEQLLGDGSNFGIKLEYAEQAQTHCGATVFAYQVSDPERYGVVEFDDNHVAMSLEEKPRTPKSNFAVTGLYFYDSNVVKYAKQVEPSPRNELEITDLNKLYLGKNELKVITLKRGFAWLDTGTHDSLLEAGNFIQTIEHRQGIKIACLEEIALHKGWISKDEIKHMCRSMGKSTYAEYLRQIVK
jgi:glucose-1-phosphate thymidylyltransferase